MYQTVGHQIVVTYAECMGLPLFRRRIQGSTRHQKLSYRMTMGDEVEDMFVLLNEVKRQIPSVTAVCSGAIASDYQRLRVESVCSRLGLVSLAYLWKQDQSLLLQEMITNGIVAITVKVAAMGLDPRKHLGKDIGFLKSYLHRLKELYGINVCGEGGEYETLTLDCPLFLKARIVLDEFDVIMESSEAIAPVGILHPLAFHLENKEESNSISGIDKTSEICPENVGFVYEVQGDFLQSSEATCQSAAEVTKLDAVAEHRLRISRTKSYSTFSICCWLQDSCHTSAGLQEDLEVVLKKIELELVGCGFNWENVLYVHLYIADMNKFTIANETYVRYITQEKCPFGVPSRSTIELPLLQVGLGSANIEVLVANDQSKRVLHVQSISCWAPSCIGPYSQATWHKEILHMAGQLGLDPPTMTLSNGGPSAELEQALENSEAVAKCFSCSISTSAILFVVYCSAYVPSPERYKIQDKLETFLKQMRLFESERENISKALDPIFLYLLVPDLPKRALVELKPVLYAPEEMDMAIGTMQDLSSVRMPSYWGFQHADWHDSCFQKCVVHGKICAVILCFTSELVEKICFDSLGGGKDNGNYPLSVQGRQMESVLRFCIYLLDKLYMQTNFSWEDTKNLRFYFPTSIGLPVEVLSLMLNNAFNELAEMDQRVIIGEEPIFNLVPVLGAGSSATSMDNILTCELFASKS
ncbi:hypothetical protein I3760_07G073100 [Carya illinoinensis]|nr:hypothetical protein I3760_07G073100 [Carya illinoinensis]